MGKILKFMVITFLENALHLGILTHAHSPVKTLPLVLISPTPQAEGNYSFLPSSIVLEICFPPKQKGVEETIMGFIKIQSENIKMAWKIRLSIFCMICNFFKCDGFTVLQITYLSHRLVLILLSFLCNHENLILKLHQKNSYRDAGWLFIHRLGVGSVPEMMNKEVLVQFKSA